MLEHHIARYRIVEQIGSGGMSVVYRGVDTALEREVAVKVLHPHLASRDESRRRFSREARAVAKLHHPNILEIFDFSGDDNAEAFIVTELVRGVTLRSFAEQHRFYPPEIAAMAVHELACALEHAHEAGVIHRDLKPENVMIRHDGVLKLMDFGIAKVLDRDEGMTMTGALVGSPAHMAPEIVEGAEASRASDIWSLGTLLYWLCCGKLPFLGNNTTQTLKRVLDGSYVDPRVENQAVSDELAEIIARTLARDPLDRFESATQLREALADLLEEAGVERPAEALPAFFAEPESYSERFQARLLERLLNEATRCVKGPRRNRPRAVKYLDRCLALDPADRRAKALLDQLNRRRLARRRLAIGATAAALLAGLSMALLAIGDATEGVERAGSDPARSAAGSAPPPAPSPSLPASDPEPAPAALAESPLPQEAQAVPASAPAAPGTAARPRAAPERAPESASRPAPRAVAQRAPAPSPEPSAPSPRAATASRREAAPVLARAPSSPRAETAPAAEPQAGPDSNAASAQGTLSVVYTPRHVARIYLDDALLNPHGNTAFLGPVPAGTRRLRIESDYCLPHEQTVEVAANALTRVEARLQRKPATLVVQSSLKDMLVVVNGTPRGFAGESEREPITVPIPDDAVATEVTLRFSREGYATEERRIEVRGGDALRLPVELRTP